MSRLYHQGQIDFSWCIYVESEIIVTSQFEEYSVTHKYIQIHTLGVESLELRIWYPNPATDPISLTRVLTQRAGYTRNNCQAGRKISFY